MLAQDNNMKIREAVAYNKKASEEILKIFNIVQKDFTKKHITLLKKKWEQKIGKCQLIYTRSEQGRQLLLKTRKYAFSNEARQKTLSSNKWS